MIADTQKLIKLFSVLVLREERVLIVYRALLRKHQKLAIIILTIIVFTEAVIAGNRVPGFNITRRVSPLARGSDRLKCLFFGTFFAAAQKKY